MVWHLQTAIYMVRKYWLTKAQKRELKVHCSHKQTHNKRLGISCKNDFQVCQNEKSDHFSNKRYMARPTPAVSAGNLQKNSLLGSCLHHSQTSTVFLYPFRSESEKKSEVAQSCPTSASDHDCSHPVSPSRAWWDTTEAATFQIFQTSRI